MKKRIIAFLLTMTMLLSVFNTGMVVFSVEANTDVAITVLDSNGENIDDERIDNSALSVSVTCAYKRFGSIRTENRPVTNFGDGVFGYNYSKQSNVQYYTVNVTLRVDGLTYTASEQVAKNADSVIIVLEDYVQSDRWETFDVYYIADGHFPNSFYGYGDSGDYGPSRDDIPLLRINVNITKLRSAEFSDAVLYQQNITNTDPDTYDKNIGNAYHFIPAQISDNEDEKKAYVENVGYANAFWTAVKKCMDKESLEAFEATGLFKNYIVYCLKNQGTAANPDNHADGILVADVTDEEIRPIEPPVYVVEMYDHDGRIFHGYTDDENSIKTNPVSVEDILSDYANQLNIENEWSEEKSDVWKNSYIKEIDGRKYLHNLQVTQKDVASPPGYISSEEIKYEWKTNTYYVATFNATLEIEPAEHILTYTDGVADEIFDQEVYPIKTGDKVVAFEGKTDRENYNFIGWTLEGGNGAILSQDDILKTYTSVNQDLTFIAVYTVAPTKYTGTVEVILNGSYDSSTATATGERIDITQIADFSLYVRRVNDDEFIPLERTSEGVYSASLENGDYKIYYYNGSEYLESSSQHLSINNDNRTRYLFFNTVTYDLNGGVGGPASLLQYKYIGTSVNVATEAPTKEGYIFKGWKDENGNIYNSGDLLTASIGKGYTLTAQWDDASDIYINVTINHTTADGIHDEATGKDDVTLNLVYAPDENTPFLETGDSIELCMLDHEKHNYTHKPEDVTVYTANGPTFANVLKDNIYTIFTDKHDYNVTSITTSRTEDGDIIIDVVLDYSPENADLEFEIKVADDVPEELVPQAAIVKVLYWSTATNKWEVISEHADSDRLKPGVRVDINGKTGKGCYSVFTKEVHEDNVPIPYGYRIVVTSLVYPDGNIVSVNNSVFENLTVNNTDLYTIKFGEVKDGEVYGELNGAYFDEQKVQQGLLDAVITAKGFNVTFDAQGGFVNGSDKQTIPNQYKVPSFAGYVPTRNVGYVFDGWYKDTSFTIPAVEGEYLNSDITLYAKWKEPLTIKGLLTVGATFEQVNEDLTITIQEIPESEWVDSLIVLLQKVEPNGYTDTVNQQFIKLDYKNKDYYYEGRIVGYSEYSFENIPDDGSTYRIQVLIPNYHSTFQNEDDSINDYLKYQTYNHEDYIAEFGEKDPDTTAIVNMHAHFSPEEFELKYSVNAEQIGSKLRPTQTEILITSDTQNIGAVPNEWTVISQMVFDDKFIGNKVEIKDGKGEGSDYVWIRRADGYTLYQYGIRVQDVVLGNGKTVKYDKNQPFTVEYKAPAHCHDDGQHGELIATLIPKTYNVNFVTNGGTLNGDYPTTHTWSYETSIAGLVPTFGGFKFDGWYLDTELTIPASDVIDAEVASDVTLYAKWIQVMDTVDLVVTINHDSQVDGGLASNFEKKLCAQLTHAERNIPENEQVYVEMSGYLKEYPDDQWHTHGNNVRIDTFEAPSFYTHLSSEYDYSVDVKLADYYVVEKTVVKTPRPDGSTLHTVNITLQFSPDLFDVNFYVQMAGDMPKAAYPQSVEVKVTSWYDDPAVDTTWDWYRITQHEVSTVTVEIKPETGRGEVECSVWHWFDSENQIPYYYRLEVVQLNWADGRSVTLNEIIPDVYYGGSGYNAEIKVENGSLPTPNDVEGATELHGVYAGSSHAQVGTLGAVINIDKVNFHTNNGDARNDDIFRTYYPAGSLAEGSPLYSLNADGTITSFYDIPEFEYETHNNYIFKGWYLDPDSTDRPLKWTDIYVGNIDVYAHWIETGTVEKEAADTKKTSTNTYLGFDLIGVQIRDQDADDMDHYGNSASGLRFITVLSEELYTKINAISGIDAEYGFVMAKSSTVTNNLGNSNATLQYKGENVNGVDTNAEYSYIKNFKCSGVTDHYEGKTYRQYTAVITYTKATGAELEKQFAQCIAARAYIRYYDANGMLRTYYNNYTGTHFYGGCSASFNDVYDNGFNNQVVIP